jgi:hypothetical protein
MLKEEISFAKLMRFDAEEREEPPDGVGVFVAVAPVTCSPGRLVPKGLMPRNLA